MNYTISQLSDYFSGKRTEFNIPLSFMYGTDFQINVWKTLLSIKFGETKSYLDIARLINNPFSYRAVGNANNKNPISIIIPCHRVIKSNGDLGGYSAKGGVKKKRILLSQEIGYSI